MPVGLRVLLVFVDGLGIGSNDPTRNPVVTGACPCLANLLASRAKPIDAQLGVPGLPQSATGQATLLTGVNAAAMMGRHIEGFPVGNLRALARQNSIFRQLTDRGLSATFANAFFVDDLHDVKERKIQSVTTVAALDVPPGLRDKKDLVAHRAVYQDLTRETLRSRGYDGPLITPEQAADDLLGIVADFDFTLFEYFQTDRAGHKGDMQEAMGVLRTLDPFLRCVVETAEKRDDFLFVLTSDHGNIEDVTTRGHTANPVPLVAIGRGARELLARVSSLVDVTPALVEILSDRRRGGCKGGKIRVWKNSRNGKS
ncbi:MAG: hypothetical protein N2255_01555 [Kiritimatiellae bacterium]|nr:hypothetical protein [Kiritimatiellia bacterium]